MRTPDAIEQLILPLVPDFLVRLEAGIDVAEVGCGSGRTLLYLAQRFPRSRFVGIDASCGAISCARASAERLRLSNAKFHVQEAAKWRAVREFDLVFTFDAVHDQARPDVVLENIRRALRPGGGLGLGAVLDKELALEMLAAAGFGNVEVEQLGREGLEFYFVCRE